jgi:PAS domain S-box-containing protein
MPKAPSSADAWSPAQLLQLVMDNIPQFIFWKDRNSVFLGCNRNFAKIAGFDSPEELVGKTDYDMPWRPEEAEFFRQVDRDVMESGRPRYHIIEPQLQAGGKEAWLDTNKIPLFDDDGEVVGILGTYEDITERKLAQEALQHAQKMEAIGQLAGGIAHDFNNLLGGIIGAADLIQNRLGAPPEIQKLAQEILKTSERAAELTSKLLAFSRRGKMQNDVFDLHEAVENVATLLRRGIDRRIDLVVDNRADDSTMRGDLAEIETALLNLGLNARDAMPEGGRLVISTENLDLGDDECAGEEFALQPGRYVRLSVQDDGIGIPEALRPRLFEPFFTTKPQGAGTGLGLSAVYGAVCSHHGRVMVDSVEGKGTTFHVDLPVIEEPAPTSTALGRRPRPLHGGTVLVIDDEPVIRVAAEGLLKELGFRVLVAENGKEGLRRLEADPQAIDVVILDVIMPDWPGRECFRRLKQLRPELPIIMSSGFTRDEFIEDITQDGAAGFLKKPYGLEALGRALERALSKARAPSSVP